MMNMHLFHRQRTHSIGPIEISGLVTARTISLRIWKCWRRDTKHHASATTNERKANKWKGHNWLRELNQQANENINLQPEIILTNGKVSVMRAVVQFTRKWYGLAFKLIWFLSKENHLIWIILKTKKKCKTQKSIRNKSSLKFNVDAS